MTAVGRLAACARGLVAPRADRVVDWRPVMVVAVLYVLLWVAGGCAAVAMLAGAPS